MSKKLWLKAMEKLKIDKSKFSREDIIEITEFINENKNIVSFGVIFQIERDVRTYKKYDAIAMWVGNGGLIEHEPQFIVGLVKIFGIKEE